MADRSPPEGKTFGHYRIQGQLGAGGMGVVYSAYDTVLERKVAIKVMGDRVLADKTARDLLLHEARAASSLNHPNICTIHEVGDSDGETYIVMEQVEGQPLSSLLGTNGLPPDSVVRYGIQIADALAHAHEHGVIHRDLKSTNAVVTPEGRVKVLDFGLAARLRDTELQEATRSQAPLTESRMIVGTLPYLAPELLRGQPAEARTDTWALGVLLYEMASGTHPFRGQTAFELSTAILRDAPTPLPTSVPSDLGAVILHCLEKSPDRRYQSAAQVRTALQRLERDSKSGFRSASLGTLAAPETPASANLWKIAVPFLLVVLLVAGGLYYRWHQNQRLTDKDTVVLADFSNSTGDPIFDDTLKTALNLSLRQSPFLNVISGSQVAGTLQMMTLPAGTKLTPDVARELCQRARSKAYIAGAIGSLGSEYVIGLKAVNCQSGDALAQEQVTAPSKEKVLNALGDAATKLRGELGESLATVQRFDVPLAYATTSSLEALKAYTLSQKAAEEKGPAAALPYTLRAIELDPSFAVGYLAVGETYSNLGELARSSQYLTKAFQLREHACEREKLLITGDYYSIVTGELDKAVETYQAQVETYPREPAGYISLGAVYAGLGQYEKAAEVTRKGIAILPSASQWYTNLTAFNLALQRFDQARQTIDEAHARKVDEFTLHVGLYALGFLGLDSTAMAEQQQWFASKPEYENFGLALASDTEAFGGHLRKARELTRQAVDSAIRTDNKEGGAIFQAIAAQREAVYGDSAQAQRLALEALKLAPASQGAEVEAALAFALAGDTARAGSLSQDLDKRFPLDTQMQSLWLPAIRTQLELDGKNPASVLNTPHDPSPIELGQIQFVANLSCLYPIYVRGEAYLAAGQGSAAAAEFQKILDHSGMVWNCWTGALAHLGVARANAFLSRNTAGADADAARVRALAAYKDFLTLWKDADPDIPILKQAKAEYAKLQ
jgi:serine/threonine protein kinase/tetratricopeptide (TPR) repeat protein